METPQSTDVLRGTLDVLILKTLSIGAMHGWGISQRIQELSKDAFRVGQGSLYPALHRMEERGWVESEWKPTEGARRAKYYQLTSVGRRALVSEVESWRRYVATVALVLENPS